MKSLSTCAQADVRPSHCRAKIDCVGEIISQIVPHASVHLLSSFFRGSEKSIFLHSLIKRYLHCLLMLSNSCFSLCMSRSESFICARLNFGTGLITLKVSKQFWTLIAQLVWSWKTVWLSFGNWAFLLILARTKIVNEQWFDRALEAKEVYEPCCTGWNSNGGNFGLRLFSNPKSISLKFWS